MLSKYFFRSDTFGRLEGARLKRRELPDTNDISNVSKEWVQGQDTHVGGHYLTTDGHWVKMLEQHIGFMDVACLVQYDNEAIRWVNLEDIPFRKPLRENTIPTQ